MTKTPTEPSLSKTSDVGLSNVDPSSVCGMLCDKDIKQILQDMAFVTANPDEPFRQEEQIQPCSIDLRLDNTFWMPRSEHAIDLRRSQLLEVDPRRHYRPLTPLQPGECIQLKPGKLIMGRVYEEFRVPPGYSAEIIGRSSFSRMGIMIHCSDGFINPGWRGHMPLQLVNFSASTIKLFPYIPICQLRIFKLSQPSERVYGHEEIQSKYANDDGGPSYWWRDKRIQRLHEKMRRVSVASAIQDDIMRRMGPQQPAILERFERYIDAQKVGNLQSADHLLDAFSRVEDTRRWFRRIWLTVRRAAFPSMLPISLALLIATGQIESPNPWLYYGHLISWLLTLMSLPATIWAFRREVGDHFGKAELDSSRQNSP